MPAVIRRLRFHDGSIRIGPECFEWHDNYARSLSFEIERVNVAVIGGLTKPPLTTQEYRWIEAAMIEAGLRMAMERVNKDGSVRKVMLPMPNCRRGRTSTNGVFTMSHHKPKHASHASTTDDAAREATARELENVAALVREKKIDFRNSNEVKLADGWDRLTFDRKLDPSLTAA